MSDITPGQIQLIHIAVNELGIGKEKYRELLCSRYDNCFTGSCKELSQAQASDLLDYFKARGFKVRKKRPARRKPTPPSIVDMITPGQREKIYALASDITWRVGVKKGLRGFTRRILKRDEPRTVEEAQLLIEALKNMRHNQQHKRQLERV